MKQHIRNITLSLIVGGFFLWLSLRNIDTTELWEYVQLMSYGWIAPYMLVCLASFWLRSERWKLLLESEKPEIRSDNLFTGVMFGYAVNYAIPRLGELTRTLFVAKRESQSTSTVLGTVVLERIIDLLAMLVLLVLVIFFVVSDRSTMDALFGPQLYIILDELRSPLVLSLLFVIGLISLYLLWKGARYVLEKRRRDQDAGLQSAGVKKIFYTFFDGLTSVRKLRKWPQFVLYTVLMWFCYALLTYIPFYAFDLATNFSLGLGEAMAVMVISTIGVSLPSPGGLGTYHWFVTQSLMVLYSVPAVTGLAYAFVTHAGMMLTVLLVTPIAWAWTVYRKG